VELKSSVRAESDFKRSPLPLFSRKCVRWAPSSNCYGEINDYFVCFKLWQIFFIAFFFTHNILRTMLWSISGIRNNTNKLYTKLTMKYLTLLFFSNTEKKIKVSNCNNCTWSLTKHSWESIPNMESCSLPYISNLHGSDYDYDFFPVQLLYQTLQQIEIQVNLVQPLCINNDHFAYKELNWPYMIFTLANPIAYGTNRNEGSIMYSPKNTWYIG
jgi:hypothetical protein